MSELPIPAQSQSPAAGKAAWTQVLTLTFTEMTSWGILYYTFSVFLGPMERDLHWTQAAMTGAYSLALLISGLVGVPFGRLLDHTRNPRPLMTIGSLLGVAGLLLWASVGALAVFYGLWVMLGIAMAATLYEPAFTTVAAWFARRERALTVLTTVSGLASVIYLPVIALLVEHAGWRMALVLLAIILALGTALPHALLLRPYPPASHVTTDAAIATDADTAADAAAATTATPSALRTWRFWQLVAGFALTQIAISALLVYLIPYLTQRGMPTTEAATASGLIGAVAFFGRILAIWRSTPETRATITTIFFLALALGIVALTLIPGIVGLALFLLLFGAGFGVYSPARAGLVADRFGSRIFGRVNGQLAFIITLARAAGPALVGLLLLWGFPYAAAFWLLAAVTVVGAALLWLPSNHGEQPK